MNLSRREFLKNTIISGVSAPFVLPDLFSPVSLPESEFCKHLKPVGRILEMQGYYVWCNSPIEGLDGKIHVFFSRWEEKYGMSGWISHCEIAHAVADSPESGFELVDVPITPRKGYFDATTCHNPHIQFIDGRYCLFYMGNSNARTNTKRIGLAFADSLYGPWERREQPLLDVSPANAWDDHCTTNPAFVRHPNGQYWLYYKSWNTQEYETAPKADRIKGNRKYGLAIAETLEGPYIKYKDNPVIDFSSGGDNRQLEDAFVWIDNGIFKLIARDMGFFNHKVGLYFESKDGINWSLPQIAYWEVEHYIKQPPAPDHLSRYGRFERPQLLMKNAKPSYLFTTSQGGKYMTASGFVFRID
jgi:hypothetical protein